MTVCTSWLLDNLMQLYHGTQVQTRFDSDRTINAATINTTRQIPRASANLTRRSFQYLPDVCAQVHVRAGMRERVMGHLLLEYLPLSIGTTAENFFCSFCMSLSLGVLALAV